MIRFTPVASAQARTILPWIVTATIAIIVLMAMFVVRPMHAEILGTEERMRSVRETIEAHQQSPDSESPELRIVHEQMINERLQEEWGRKQKYIRTFREERTLQDILVPSPSIEGRIDFKVALYEARQRLSGKAREHSVTLPFDLGIPDTIGADEDAETRLRQLAATVLLLEKCIEMNVPVIEEVTALPPRVTELHDDAHKNISFYPVRIRMIYSYEGLLDMLDMLSQDSSFFGLRRFNALSLSPEKPDKVLISTEWSAAVFTMASLSDTIHTDRETDPYHDWFFYYEGYREHD